MSDVLSVREPDRESRTWFREVGSPVLLWKAQTISPWDASSFISGPGAVLIDAVVTIYYQSSDE